MRDERCEAPRDKNTVLQVMLEQEWLYLASRSRQGADAEVVLKKGQGISPDACFESTRMLSLGHGAKNSSPSKGEANPSKTVGSSADGGGPMPETTASAGTADESMVGAGSFVELPDVYPGDKVCMTRKTSPPR